MFNDFKLRTMFCVKEKVNTRTPINKSHPTKIWQTVTRGFYTLTNEYSSEH
jgi:hypothetical protein